MGAARFLHLLPSRDLNLGPKVIAVRSSRPGYTHTTPRRRGSEGPTGPRTLLTSRSYWSDTAARCRRLAHHGPTTTRSIVPPGAGFALASPPGWPSARTVA